MFPTSKQGNLTLRTAETSHAHGRPVSQIKDSGSSCMRQKNTKQHSSESGSLGQMLSILRKEFYVFFSFSGNTNESVPNKSSSEEATQRKAFSDKSQSYYSSPPSHLPGNAASITDRSPCSRFSRHRSLHLRIWPLTTEKKNKLNKNKKQPKIRAGARRRLDAGLLNVPRLLKPALSLRGSRGGHGRCNETPALQMEHRLSKKDSDGFNREINASPRPARPARPHWG